MNIRINVNVEQLVPQVLEDGLILVLFREAELVDNTVEEPIRVNSVAELKEQFKLPEVSELPEEPTEDDLDEHMEDVNKQRKAFNELYSAEYLLRTGANILCFKVSDTITEDEIEAIEDIENLNYRLIVVPSENIEEPNDKLDLLLDFVKDSDVQLYLNLDLGVDAEAVKLYKEGKEAVPAVPGGEGEEGTPAVPAVEGKAGKLSKNVELFKNFGLPRFPSTFPMDIDTNDFDLEKGFLGIPTAIAVAARKSKLLNLKQSWIPVAGEQNGLVNEFFKLAEKITRKEKENLQAENVNVLISKMGVGNILVSQNTMLDLSVDNPKNPFYRSHVVTSALMIKRELNRIANSASYRPNTSNTWESLRLKMKSFFANLVSKEAVEEFEILVGLGITMTEEDVENGLLKVKVRYLPIRVIEAIEFNIVIQQQTGSIDIDFTGLSNLLEGVE